MLYWQTCLTYFKVVQSDPFRPRPFRFLLFSLVLLHQSLNGTLALVGVLSFAWSSDIVSPFSFSSLKSYGFFASALHRYGVCSALNEIDSFANELSTCQIEKMPSRKAWEIQVFSKNKKICKKRKKILWDSNSGTITLKLSTEYLQFKTWSARLSL